MNSENFHEYLKNPSKLHQVNYQELKSLVLQYPYSPNLWLLLLLKSVFEQNKDMERNLSLAALYSPDRSKLRKLFLQYAHLSESRENYELAEDYLELKDLSGAEDLPEKQKILVNSVSGQDISQRKEQQFPDLEEPDPQGGEELPEFLEEQGSPGFLEDLPEEIEGSLGEMPSSDETREPAGEHSGGAGQASQSEESEDEVLPLPEDTFFDDMDAHESGEVPIAEPAGLPDQPDLPVESSQEDWSEIREDEPQAPNPADREEPELSEELPAAVAPGEMSPSAQSAREIPLQITNEEELPSEFELPTPLPKDRFDSWKHTLQAPGSKLLAKGFSERKKDKKRTPPKEQKKKDEADQIAAQSLQEDNEIASETLALVLSLQGHYEKAISMYERLCLQYPEKSSFFAAKIETLKKKIV